MRIAFWSAALLGPGGRALGVTGFPFGIHTDGPTLSTPSSGGGTAAADAVEGTGGGGGCCCSTVRGVIPWLRIRALVKVVDGKKYCIYEKDFLNKFPPAFFI